MSGAESIHGTTLIISPGEHLKPPITEAGPSRSSRAAGEWLARTDQTGGFHPPPSLEASAGALGSFITFRIDHFITFFSLVNTFSPGGGQM